MKFIADMGISKDTVEFLNHMGHDAVHLYERGGATLSDMGIIEIARNEMRIVLTNDLDFGDLMAAGKDALPSIIVFRLRNMKPENVNIHLSQVLFHHQDPLEKGAIVSVMEGRARIRSLPV